MSIGLPLQEKAACVGIDLDREAISKLSAALSLLRENGFESLLEVTVYFAVLEAELAGSYLDVTACATLTETPLSTFSRIAWNLHERGLIRFEGDARDRRRKVMRANLDTAASSKPAE